MLLTQFTLGGYYCSFKGKMIVLNILLRPMMFLAPHTQIPQPWPTELILENSFEKWFFFDFFQTICFWKAETELEINLLEFLGSKVIWARERSSKVSRSNFCNLKITHVYHTFLETSRVKYVGFIFTLDVRDHSRSWEVVRGR